MSRRGRQILKEQLLVKNDDDMLGDVGSQPKTSKGKRRESNRSAKVRQNLRKGEGGVEERGVPDMNLIEDSEMINLGISGKELHKTAPEGRDNKKVLIITGIVLIFLVILYFLLSPLIVSLTDYIILMYGVMVENINGVIEGFKEGGSEERTFTK